MKLDAGSLRIQELPTPVGTPGQVDPVETSASGHEGPRVEIRLRHRLRRADLPTVWRDRLGVARLRPAEHLVSQVLPTIPSAEATGT